MAFTLDPEPPKIFAGAGRRNPRLTDGTTEVEMTYPPQSGSPGPTEKENASFQTTLGGSERKQADSWLRSVIIQWKEPGNFVPTKIHELMRGGGNRSRNTLTYKHHAEVLSQLPGVEADEDGVVPLNGFIRRFIARPTGLVTEDGLRWYQCELRFQEANEVQP